MTTDKHKREDDKTRYNRNNKKTALQTGCVPYPFSAITYKSG